MAATEIIIRGRDNWSERRLDAIEAAARGKIIRHWDDGCGNMTFVVGGFHHRPNAAERKAILAAVQVIAPNARWA